MSPSKTIQTQFKYSERAKFYRIVIRKGFKDYMVEVLTVWQKVSNLVSLEQSDGNQDETGSGGEVWGRNGSVNMKLDARQGVNEKRPDETMCNTIGCRMCDDTETGPHTADWD